MKKVQFYDLGSRYKSPILSLTSGACVSSNSQKFEQSQIDAFRFFSKKRQGGPRDPPPNPQPE